MNCEVNVTYLAAYRLRRAYAEGWNRAQELSQGERANVALCGMEALNPYAADPERSGWNEGFAKADTP